MHLLLHFDQKSHIGLICHEDSQALVLPPYTHDSIRETDMRFDGANVICGSMDRESLLRDVQSEANIQILEAIANLWKKQSTGSHESLSIDKSKSIMFRTFNKALMARTLMPADMIDVHCFRLCFGLSDQAVTRLLKWTYEHDRAVVDSLRYLLTHPFTPWQDRIDEILDYTYRVLIPGQRLDTARSALLTIKMHASDLPPQTSTVLDQHLSSIQAGLTMRSIDRKEPLARPWQKYVKTNLGRKVKEDTSFSTNNNGKQPGDKKTTDDI